MNPESPRDDMVREVAALPRELAPGAALEERTVARLRQAGLLRSPLPPRSRWWMAAAAVAIFFGGVAAGRAWTPSPVVLDQPRFMLLLHGDVAGAQVDEMTLVEEYRAWAVRLRSQGRFVSGERLGAVVAVVPAAAAIDAAGLRGYFLISAPSFEDAVAVARSCPHARRGGHVIVRPINPT